MIEPPSLKRLNPEDLRPPFDCDDDDLNEFFTKDSIISGRELLSVTYVLEQNNKTIAFFSVSNDSIKKENVPPSKNLSNRSLTKNVIQVFLLSKLADLQSVKPCKDNVLALLC